MAIIMIDEARSCYLPGGSIVENMSIIREINTKIHRRLQKAWLDLFLSIQPSLRHKFGSPVAAAFASDNSVGLEPCTSDTWLVPAAEKHSVYATPGWKRSFRCAFHPSSARGTLLPWLASIVPHTTCTLSTATSARSPSCFDNPRNSRSAFPPFLALTCCSPMLL